MTKFGPIFDPILDLPEDPRGTSGEPLYGVFQISASLLGCLHDPQNPYSKFWHAKMSNMYTSTRSSQKSNLGIKITILGGNEVFHVFGAFFQTLKNTVNFRYLKFTTGPKGLGVSGTSPKPSKKDTKITTQKTLNFRYPVRNYLACLGFLKNT